MNYARLLLFCHVSCSSLPAFLYEGFLPQNPLRISKDVPCLIVSLWGMRRMLLASTFSLFILVPCWWRRLAKTKDKDLFNSYYLLFTFHVWINRCVSSHYNSAVTLFALFNTISKLTVISKTDRVFWKRVIKSIKKRIKIGCVITDWNYYRIKIAFMLTNGLLFRLDVATDWIMPTASRWATHWRYGVSIPLAAPVALFVVFLCSSKFESQLLHIACFSCFTKCCTDFTLLFLACINGTKCVRVGRSSSALYHVILNSLVYQS